MKKITFLTFMCIGALGFSQTFPIDFDDPADANFDPFNGAVAGVVDNDGDNVLQLSSVGANFDGASLSLLVAVDLSDDANNTITFTVDPQDTLEESEVRTHLLKFEGGANGPSVAQLFFDTTGPNEQSISLDFGTGLGSFSTIVLFMDAGADNVATGNYYIDDIAGGTNAQPTCTDGIQNGNETGVDCGGPDCDDCLADPEASPTPLNYTSHLALQSNITDTSAFSNFWEANEFFGAEPMFIDLDQTASENVAAKIDLSIGWGGGITDGTLETTDVSAYDTVHFDYYIPSAVDPGVNGHQFYLDLISRTAGANSEAFYGVGVGAGTGGDNGSGVIDEQVVFDSWQGVDIPMTTLVGKGFDSTNFFQFKIGAQSDIRTQLGYFDNLYFYDSSTLGTERFNAVIFKTYPNPTANNWNVESNTTIKSIVLYNILGKQVSTLTPNANAVEISSTSLNPGMYFAKIEGETGSKTIKLIKE